MKKTVKKGLGILTACVLLCALAACGQSSGSSSAASSSAASVQTSAAAGTQASSAAAAGAEAEESSQESDELSVQFDYNYEGSPEAVTVQVAYDDVAEPPADPVRENYEFLGWFTDAECTEDADFEYSITEDTTFYAGWKASGITVTFSANYEGGTDTTQIVPVGEAVGEPSAPQRDGYLFDGWYADAEGTTAFDFTTSILEETLVYAKWEEKVAGTDYFTVTFMWNYEGAPNDGVYSQIQVAKNSKISSVTPERGEDYYLASGNWYTDPECTSKFKFSTTRITEDTVLYARWYNRYTFEAENTDFTGKSGLGYSGTVSDTMLIIKDKFGANASGGYYVSYLFYNGAYLEFHIDAAADVDDAVLDLRLSTEMMSIDLTDQEFLVEVNGEDLSYGSISLPFDLEGSNGYSDDQKQPFSDYYMTTKLSLKEGENVIRLIVNNDRQMGSSGTMYATAPIIDCIHISTDTELSWSEGYPMNTDLTSGQ